PAACSSSSPIPRARCTATSSTSTAASCCTARPAGARRWPPRPCKTWASPTSPISSLASTAGPPRASRSRKSNPSGGPTSPPPGNPNVRPPPGIPGGGSSLSGSRDLRHDLAGDQLQRGDVVHVHRLEHDPVDALALAQLDRLDDLVDRADQQAAVRK